MPRRPRRLTARQVAKIIGPLAGSGAILVGGQALFFWGEFFARSARDIEDLRPFTSRDVDFYGFKDAAQSLAASLNATVRVPRASDHTPNTALVEAQVGRRRIVIDFLWHVAGVPDKALRRRAGVEGLRLGRDGPTLREGLHPRPQGARRNRSC